MTVPSFMMKSLEYVMFFSSHSDVALRTLCHINCSKTSILQFVMVGKIKLLKYKGIEIESL